MSKRNPTLEAGRLALDFLNARLGPDPGSVVAWLIQAGVAGGEAARRLAASPPLGRTLLAEGLALQDALAAAAEAFAGGRPLPEPALFALNRVLDASRGALRVEVAGPHVVLKVDAETRLPLGLLAPVAAAAARLFAAGDRARLRRCASPRCARWFYDASRNGARRWCSMARCGNRAKVAAHYRRRRRAPESTE